MKRNRLEKSMAWMLSVGMLLSNAPLVQANQVQTLKNDEIYDDSTVVAERSVSYSKKMESFARNLVTPTSGILSNQNIPGVFTIPGVPEYATASFWSSAVSGGEVEAVERTTATITLVLGDGATGETTAYLNENGTIEDFDTFKPTLEGFDFLGWSTTSGGTVDVAADTVLSDSGTIYAVWEESVEGGTGGEGEGGTGGEGEGGTGGEGEGGTGGEGEGGTGGEGEGGTGGEGEGGTGGEGEGGTGGEGEGGTGGEGEGGTGDDQDQAEAIEITAGGTYSADGDYYISANLTLTEEIKFIGTSASDPVEVSFDLNDFTLTGSGVGSVICLENAVFELTDGENGTGIITGGKGTEVGISYYGGGIYAVNSEITIKGGTISGNTADYGGGIAILEESADSIARAITASHLTVSGGKITGNTAVDGGAIYAHEAMVTVTGGEISGNTASGNGKGILLDSAGCKLNLNGTVTIKDEVYLKKGATIVIGSGFDISKGNSVPISMESPGSFTNGATSDDLDKFTSVDEDLDFSLNDDGELDLTEPDEEEEEEEVFYKITLLTTEGGTVDVTVLTTDGEGFLNLTDLEAVKNTPVTGYSFKGWYTTATGSTEVDTSIAFTGDTSIYAQWNWDTKYYISLNANGGTVGATSAAISSPTNGYLTSYSSIPIPKRDGYTFLGWFTTAAEPIESARVSTATLFTEGDTIYAHWDKIAVDDGDGMYTVLFDSNYTWGSTVAKDVEAGTAVSKIPDPTRSGYTLTGWFQEGGGEWNFSNPVTGDMTLVAQWVYGGFYDSYTVSFEANDDDGNYYTMEAIIGTYGAYVGEPADPTRENYIFLGWYDENGNLFDFCRQIYKDRALEARWKADGYEVTFDPNFGDEESTIVIVEENTTVTKPTNPTRSGYVFTGWHLDGELFDFDDRIKEDITLVANWSRDGIYDESGVIRYNNQIVVMPFGDASVYPSLPEEGNIVTITPNKNYTVKFIMTVNSTGEEVTLNKYANGSYYFIQPANSVVITIVYQEAFPYLDVYPGDWYYHAVSQLYDNGLLGDSQYYYPDMGAERASVATMLYQIDGSPITNFKDIYPDVSYTDDFAIPVTWASEYAIFVGYDDGLFRPYTAITRQDLALVLSRYAMVKGEDISSGNPTNAYYDNHTISNYALESLNWALEQNIITGVSSSILSPTGDIDKGEFALVMYDFQENILG